MKPEDYYDTKEGVEAARRRQASNCEVFRILKETYQDHRGCVLAMCEMGRWTPVDYVDYSDEIRDKYIRALKAFNDHRLDCPLCKELNPATYRWGSDDVIRIDGHLSNGKF